ncbi:tellurite resistance TerB family protein [Colwellia sp. MEBiC06753]
MINKIQRFFEQVFAEQSLPEEALDVEIACAVLLVEVMKADGLITDDELSIVATTLTQYFSLTPIEVDDIIEQAIALSENANDFYQFTSTLNKHYNPEQKTKIVSILWQLAQADGEVVAIEQHVIRKIADLLHLRHSEYTQAKAMAEQTTSAD